MSTRIAINGLGRVGRALLRQAVLSDDLEVVGVNDVADPTTLRALLRRDSTYGRFPVEVEAGDDFLVVDGRKIPWSQRHDSRRAAVGRARRGRRGRVHRAGSAPPRPREVTSRRVPARSSSPRPARASTSRSSWASTTGTYDPAHHDVVSNASCTTNCVAPMVKVLHDAFGIEQGFMTTVHAYTGDQNLLDGPHKDLRRARSAAVNIIPTTTGAARAVGQVLPELDGRLDGVALRVPVVTGSLVDLAVLLEREVTVDEVNAAFEAASLTEAFAGRLLYEDEPFVSADVVGEAASCVFDSSLTQAAGRFVKIFGWYDNEWGYVCRLVELVRLVGHSAGGTGGASS